MIAARDAAKQKGCTKAAVIEAIHKGLIDAERLGNMWAIVQNPKYEAWQPLAIKQKAGKARAAKAKKQHRGR